LDSDWNTTTFSKPREIVRARDRALRVGRGGEVEGDRARQELVGQRIEVGQEAGGGGGRQEYRIGVGRDRPGFIGAVERVGHQDRRAAGSAFGPAFGRDPGQEQALARAIEDQHLGRGIDRTG
jgi:hypothetical protein